MLKKDFIKKIRAGFKDYRECTGRINTYFYVNGMRFTLSDIKIRFNDKLEELYIHSRNTCYIICSINYEQILSIGSMWS